MATTDTPTFRPLYDTVYDALRQRIMDGTLRAGETVTEAQIAESLDVSRTPVRDALRRLVAENLVVMPKKGAVRVYSPTAADLADVYCTRATLEGMAARLAAMRSSDDLVAELNEICDRCARLSVDDTAGAAALNGQFHQLILQRADNARITNLLANLNPVIVRYRHISLAFRNHLAQSWEEHRTIAQLFADWSPDTVETHVRLHILKAGGRIVAAMRALEGTTASTPSMDLVLNA